MLKNIVFDFGNVIMNWNPDRLLEKYNLTSDQRELIKSKVFSSKEWLEIDAGLIDEDQATKIFMTRVPPKLRTKVKNIMQTWPSKVEFYEPVFEFMKELKKRGYHLYGLSNTGMRFANYVKNSKWDQNFEGYVFSAQEKIMKPDDRIYQLLLNRYNLHPNECLFVDDRQENIDAAKRNGMNGFTFDIKRLTELNAYIKQH